MQAVKQWPEPYNLSEVRSFLGLCGYYRRFIPGFSERAKLLTRLTEKGIAMIWSEKCQQASLDLKDRLCKAPVLAIPDFTHAFILGTDTSNLKKVAVLSRMVTTKECLYDTRTLTKAERQYCVTGKELLAVVYFVKYYKHCPYGKQFTVRIDHSSLR